MNASKQGISWATLLVGVIIGAIGMLVLMGIVDRIRNADTVTLTMSSEKKAAAQTNVNRILSQTHMRSIVQGLISYAGNHDGQFPPRDRWPETLIDEGYIAVEILSSPLGGEYTLVTMPQELDATVLVLYENPDHFETGVNVVFADTSVGHLPHAEFERLLAEQNQSQSP